MYCPDNLNVSMNNTDIRYVYRNTHNFAKMRYVIYGFATSFILPTRYHLTVPLMTFSSTSELLCSILKTISDM